jgi:hypothetical protein
MDATYAIGIGVATGVARGLLGMVAAWATAQKEHEPFTFKAGSFAGTFVLAGIVGAASGFLGMTSEMDVAMSSWLGSEIIHKVYGGLSDLTNRALGR